MPDIPDSDFVEIQDNGRTYFLAHLGDLYSCTCDEWKGQLHVAETRRSCKHLRDYRGAEEEDLRIDPLGAQPRFPASTTARVGMHQLDTGAAIRTFADAGDDQLEIACWSVIVPYEPDINSALQRARKSEFITHFSEWPSMDEATMEATGTILDIKYVSNQTPPGICSTAALPEHILRSVFGTAKPRVENFNRRAQRAITRQLLAEWGDDPQEFCLQSYYIVLYEKRRDQLTPVKIAFAGWSDDC